MRDGDDEIDGDGDAPAVSEADMARFLAGMSEEGLTDEQMSRRFLDFVAEQAGIDPERVEAPGDRIIVIRGVGRHFLAG